jgi:hypothetical protein
MALQEPLVVQDPASHDLDRLINRQQLQDRERESELARGSVLKTLDLIVSRFQASCWYES